MKNNKVIIGINASFLRKPETGIGQVTINFLKKLIELKIQDEKIKTDNYHFILYLEQDLKKGIELPENFEKRVFQPIWKRDDLIRKIWWEKYLLPKRVTCDKCDVFISMYQCPTVFSESTRHIMVVHDIIPKLFPHYLNNFRKKLYWNLTEKGIRKANKIIAVSRKTKEDLIKKMKIPEAVIDVCYIDVDNDFKIKVSSEKSDEILEKFQLKSGYIFAGGGMETRKNIKAVVRAYKYLLDLNHEEKFIDDLPQLVIYGKLLPQLAPLAVDAEKEIEDRGISKKVRLLGSVPQKYMPALFQNASMFIYPSLYEGFGIPPLEAINSGLPVVLSDRSSLPEIGGDSVLYCNPEKITEIAECMKIILLDQAMRENLSKKAKEKAAEFSWDDFTERILKIIDNL